MESIKVYCVIVTFNAMKWVDKCLGSLGTSSLKVYPVIIDNCSSDETVNYIKENYPEAHLIINNENKGFGQANNQGIEYAYKQGASHFFLLNQDAWVYEDTIARLVNVQDIYNLGIASPIHLNGQGNLLDYNYFSYTVLSEANIEYVSDLILNNLKPFYTISKVNAAAWMLSRNTIERVGGFDPIFFHYGEDGNYCQRIKFHKEKIGFVTEAFIHHDRDKKGNFKVFKKNAIVAMLLNEYADVNKSIWRIDKIRFKMHMANVKLGISLLLKLKVKDFASLFNSYVTFIEKLQKASNHMELNKTVHHNWLDLK